jgi:acyl dehydratase
MNKDQLLPEWALESVPADAMRVWSEAARDANPIHVDAAAAEALGFGPRCINPGPINLAYIVNMLEAALPDADITHIEARFSGNVAAGDSVIAQGHMTGEARDHITASLRRATGDEILLSADITVRQRP